MTIRVDRLMTLRSPTPGDDTAGAIEARGKLGWTLITILPLNDEIQVVWDDNGKDEDGVERATNEPEAEQR